MLSATGREHTEHWGFDMRRTDANRAGTQTARWPFSEPFHVTWERALTDHLALGHRLPYALLRGFWDARTLRRVER